MSGDYSRQRFDPHKHFSAVLMQQGRVQLDADWNEQGAILDRRWRAETADLIGRGGVPKETPDGFKIVAAGETFTIGPGRIYVDGLLAENHGQQPVAFDPVLAEPRGTTAVSYTEQPYFPAPPRLGPGRHLVYLDVWQREVTTLEEPGLLEPAVGVESTARLQTVWQVKVLPNIGTEVTCTTPDVAIPGWPEVLQPAAGRLSTAADRASSVLENPCLLSPGVGYTGLENQLYRVEIHDGGPLGLATFKWSRDNATVATLVLAIPALDHLLVDSTGRDAVLRFNAGDWVEMTDDVRELHGLPGEMRQIRSVDDTTLTLILERPLPAGVFAVNEQGQTDPARHTRVRRWDQHGKVLDTNGNLLIDLDDPGPSRVTREDADVPVPPGVIPIPGGAGTSIMLEYGVRIAFDTASPDGAFRTGDYWVFATRTVDASVESLTQAPPHGIHHHYCRLALLDVDNNHQVTAVVDCRQLFPHGQLAITTGEVLFESTPTNQEVVSGPIDSGLGSGPICVILGMAQGRPPVVTQGHIAQALLTAEVEPPSGQFKVRAVRQNQVQGVTQMLVYWWAFRPERHLGQVVVGAVIVVTVTPPPGPVVAGGPPQQFTATVTGTANTAVTWSVNDIPGGNATVGTISPQGLYQAPGVVPSPATVTVRATSVIDTSKSGQVAVTIQPPVVVTVTPSPISVLAGTQQSFTPHVTGTINTAVTWSVNNIPGGNTTAGTISPQGLYQAPGIVPSPATVTVRATSVIDTSKSGPATVTVQPQIVVQVDPPTPTVLSGGTLPFQAFVSGTDDKRVTWSVNDILGGNATVGTISPQGLYQAPVVLAPAQVIVRATSVADPNKNGLATVTVNPLIKVTVFPPTPTTVLVGSQRQFNVTVTGASQTAVTWSITGAGTIDQTGFYKAPFTLTTPATVTVRATSEADKAASGTTTVTIPAVSVKVSPPTRTLARGASDSFSFLVSNVAGPNIGVTWSVEELNAGSITPGGLYTAPNKTGTFHVVATSVADPSKSDKATITVV